jgi:tripartite-type tricarboxylate transporter receptor subunit TctC
VSSARRAITMPDVPPIAESADLPNFDIGAWGGYMAPAGTPREIVSKISAAIQKALQEPATRERLIQIGLDVEYKSPEDFAAFLAKEYVRYGDIARRANIRLD